MKKFTRLFILAILGSCFVGVTLSQEDYWMNPSSYIDYIDTRCKCGWQPVNTLFLLIDIIVLSLLISLLLFPLRRAFKKAGQKPRYSIIPYRNSYVLIKMNSNIKIKKMFIFIYTLLCGLLILGMSRDYHINPIQEYLYQKFSYGCCEGRTIVNITFIGLPLVLFVCDFLILLFQLYKLSKKFGLKRFSSILIALFFPIGVRILSFGNYEYIGNKEKDNNLESK